MGESCWRLEGTGARLSVGAAGAGIDLTRPAAGLALQFPGTAKTTSPCKILGVRFDDAQPIDAARLDAYVRGDDLVATYDETLPRRVRAQIYWRLLKAAEFSPPFAEHVPVAFDLIVSVNTSLLDSDPQSSVHSEISPAGGVLGVVSDGAGSSDISAQEMPRGSKLAGNLRGFIVRPAQGEFSYVEIVHPAESCRCEAKWLTNPVPDESRGVQLTQHLFQQRLEKGVILRAWIRAALVAQKHDEATAVAAYRHFAAAEPPLTV